MGLIRSAGIGGSVLAALVTPGCNEPISSPPITVIGVTAQPLAAGYSFTCALTGAGAAYCWGYNSDGQLGNGSTTSSSTPVAVAVAGGVTFTAVVAGGSSPVGYGSHACTLTRGGAAYCWGRNSNGQLGDGSTTSSSTPVAVSGGLSFSALATGAYHTCGLTSTGAAYCWGSNSVGQLGDGSTTSSARPVAVAGGLSFSALATGGSGAGHTCGLTRGGAAYC